MQKLSNLEPNTLEKIAWHSRLPEGFQSINFCLSAPQIHIVQAYYFRTLDELVTKEEAQVDRDVDVGRYEISRTVRYQSMFRRIISVMLKYKALVATYTSLHCNVASQDLSRLTRNLMKTMGQS